MATSSADARCQQIGGVPSSKVIQSGELVLLDFSVVIDGYRGDFCNTFVCDGTPSCPRARIVRGLFRRHAGGRAGLAGRHAVPRCFCMPCETSWPNEMSPSISRTTPGTASGWAIPEPPFLVPESSETLAAGDVVTLEPGVYLPGVAGMRYERNYLITNAGYELLSDHPIRIDAK